MSRFRTVFLFELKGYLKNKVVIGVTLFLIVASAVLLFSPRFTGGRDAGPKQAAEFSFVMSIPVIAGAALLEFAETGRIQAALDGAEIPGFPVAIGPALAAAALAGAVGWLALRAVVRVLDRGAFWMVGPYCLAAGALAWIFA